TTVDQCQRTGLVGAEDDIDISEVNGDGHFLHPTPIRVIRSSTMASTTMARPASSPRSILREPSARLISVPRPPAPISAANNTIDSDNSIDWVRPAMMVGSAEGNSTFQSSWLLVAPNASPAS